MKLKINSGGLFWLYSMVMIPVVPVYPGAATAAGEDAPAHNVVLIVVDDLGAGDVGCYGGEGLIPTPNLDRLASQGMRALDAHSASAVCTPSRYAIETGRYYWSPWIGELLVDTEKPTIASVFREHGFATGYFGKWHLGWGPLFEGRRHRQDIDWNGTLPEGVLECGYDTYFGTPFSHNEPPFVFVHDRHIVGLDPDDPIFLDVPGRTDPDRDGRGFGVSRGARAAHEARPVDRIDLIVTEKAVAYIQEHADRRFFLNLNLVAPHVPIAPAKEFRGKTGLGDYADFVAQLDWCVGEIMRALEECGLDEDTLVIFTSDNGAVVREEVLALGHRSNQDRLGQKTDVWEGGVRVPFLARLPGTIPAGSTTDALIALLDIARTSWIAAGIEMPEDVAPESLNQLPVLSGRDSSGPRKEMLYLGTRSPFLALRSGDWVFLPGQGSFGETTAPGSSWLGLVEMGRQHSDYDENGILRADAPLQQLYNLQTDPGQEHNVIRSHAEKAEELKRRHEVLFQSIW